MSVADNKSNNVGGAFYFWQDLSHYREQLIGLDFQRSEHYFGKYWLVHYYNEHASLANYTMPKDLLKGRDYY
jgi:hypothetical protein